MNYNVPTHHLNTYWMGVVTTTCLVRFSTSSYFVSSFAELSFASPRVALGIFFDSSSLALLSASASFLPGFPLPYWASSSILFLSSFLPFPSSYINVPFLRGICSWRQRFSCSADFLGSKMKLRSLASFWRPKCEKKLAFYLGKILESTKSLRVYLKIWRNFSISKW